ncbi:MAG: Fur family transcriptional regulator [Acidobacteriota bacterium]
MIINKLKRINLKATPQRIAIVKFLEGNTSHPSAEDIYNAISKIYPSISFATVYNTLKALHEKGEILELSIDPERKRYDPNVTPHNHFICLLCGKVVDIFNDVNVSLKLPGYEIKSKHVEFHGFCPKCKEKRK